MHEPPKHFWTTVNGLRMHAFQAGPPSAARHPIVLVHGLGVSNRYFVPLARVLARDFHVLAPNLPGTGRSERPSRALDVRGASDALAGWLDRLGHARVSFVANSLGCQVVADLSARRPALAHRLVLVGPTVDWHWRTLARQVPRWLLELTREPPSIFPILVTDYLRYGPLRFLASGRHALRYRLERVVPTVQAPTLVVRGERDSFVSRQWAATLVSRLPRGELVEIAHSGHATHYAKPEEVGALVRRFVQTGSSIPAPPRAPIALS